jgi:integrase
VRELTEGQVEQWLDESILGNATLCKCFIVLRGSLKLARKQKLIEAIPLETLHAPTWKREKEIRPFNRKEVSILLAAQNHYRVFLRVMLSVGMRPGELAALQWCDLDFSSSDQNARHGVIRVRRSRAEVDGVVTFKDPKTESSVRSIAMDLKLRQALIEHRDEQLERGVVPRDGLVFLTPHGKVIRKNNLLNHYWQPLLKRLDQEHSHDDSVDFSPRVIYHCRHTAATLMLGAGVPVHVVSGILGHERISYTWDLYSHLLPEQQKAAVDARSEYL